MKLVGLGSYFALTLVLAVGAFSQGGRIADVTVSLDGSGNSLDVSPDPVDLELGDRLRWRSSGEQGDMIEIEIDPEGGLPGPFPLRGDTENPQRGRYTKNVGSPIVTEAASDRGSWKYTVVWIRSDGRRIPLDPRIIVR